MFLLSVLENEDDYIFMTYSKTAVMQFAILLFFRTDFIKHA